MATAKSHAPVQLEIGETVKSGASSKVESPVQLEIAGIVEKYADSAAAVQKGAMGDISRLQRDIAFGSISAPAKESPYETLAAGEGGVTLVLKEDPAKTPELLGMLEKFNKKTAMEKLPTLAVPQRERIMGYYKLAKSQQGLNDRAVASGVSGMVLGYVEIEDVRRFVEEYSKTGKLPKGLPLPHANFKGASEKFPGAETYLANELSSTKKLDEQIGTIVALAGDEYDKKAAEYDKKAAEARKQIELLSKLLGAIK